MGNDKVELAEIVERLHATGANMVDAATTPADALKDSRGAQIVKDSARLGELLGLPPCKWCRAPKETPDARIH